MSEDMIERVREVEEGRAQEARFLEATTQWGTNNAPKQRQTTTNIHVDMRTRHLPLDVGLLA